MKSIPVELNSNKSWKYCYFFGLIQKGFKQLCHELLTTENSSELDFVFALPLHAASSGGYRWKGNPLASHRSGATA
jgi:hypothetical protein